MAKLKSKKSDDKVIDYIMQDVLPQGAVQQAATDSIKNKSGAGIGEKPLHQTLKQKLKETKSPMVADQDKPIIDPELDKEEEDFYTSEDTGLVEEQDKPLPLNKQKVDLNEEDNRKMSKGFKDALMHFGPRLASLLVGGAQALEGYESGMEGFQEAMSPTTAGMDFQQVEELRDKDGNPLTFSKQTGKFYNVKGEITTAFSDPKMAQIKETQKTDLAKARSDFKTKIVKEFNSSIAESEKAIGMAKSAMTLIQSDSKLAMPVAARAIARLAGEGTRMTDKDVEQFMGSQAISDSLKRTYQRAVDGTMTEEDKAVMMDAIKKMQEVESGIISQTRDDLATRYGAIDENLATKEDVLEVLSVSNYGVSPQESKSTPKLTLNQKVMVHPKTGKRYIVDKTTNQIVGEYK